MRALFWILVLCVSGVVVRAQEGGPLRSEVHVYVAPQEAWPRVLIRMPFSALVSDQPRAAARFVTGPPMQLNSDSYKSDFSDFSDLAMAEVGLRVAGDGIRPGFGALALLDTRGASGPFAGLLPNLSLLEICGALPVDAPVEDVDLVLLLLLYDLAPLDGFDLDLPAGMGTLVVTDHRSGRQQRLVAPGQVMLPAVE